jgi:prophage regulatory protein
VPENLRKFLTKAQVLEATTLCYGTIWKMMQEGTFPHSRQLGDRAIGWDESEIRAWLDSRPKTVLKSDKLATAAAAAAVPVAQKTRARAGGRHVR